MNANTRVTVTTKRSLGLRLQALHMHEAVSQPYELSLELAAEDADVDYADLLGEALGVRLTHPDGRERHFHGLVAHVEAAGSQGRLALFRAAVRPALWFLHQSVDSRIFQNRSVPDIVIEGVLKARGIDAVENELSARYAPREHCVQYGESDFDFVSRLLEEEGIHYFFRHEARRHVLVLCDSTRAYQALPVSGTVPYRPQSFARMVGGGEGVTDWRERGEVVPRGVALRDHDFRKPRMPVMGITRSAPPQGLMFDQFEFPAGVQDRAAAEARAGLRREALQGGQRCFLGQGNVFELGVGRAFTLSGHARERLNQDYLVIGATHELVSGEVERGSMQQAPGFRWTSSITARARRQGVFRPPRRTPRPVMRGPQTAVVTGPQGQEIHTDAYGRVKLLFHWDRSGPRDDGSSCWVRVAQGAAGRHWGSLWLPRVGDEEVVDFLHGDPDRPLVTGAVANADRMPPLELPAQRTRSTFKTRSTPDGGEENFNELRFEDQRGREEIYLHAERDFTRVVENDDRLRVGFDKQSPGNQSVAVFNDQTVEVGSAGCAGGSQRTTVWKDREVRVCHGDDRLRVEQGNSEVKVAAGTHTIEAAVAIVLRVGNNSITIDRQGIRLEGLQIVASGNLGVKVEGLQVQVQSQTTLDLKGLCTTVDAQALAALKGALVLIN
jgi:type VI secretion system secreted protein VgrG